MQVQSFTLTVTDPIGIHARPAGILVKKASEFKSSCTIEKDGKSADLKRLFPLLGLCVKSGDKVQISISGEDEEIASDSIKQCFTELLT